jgi:hypothetical protein
MNRNQSGTALAWCQVGLDKGFRELQSVTVEWHVLFSLGHCCEDRMVANTPCPEGTPQFRSPKRSLALSFRLSRDRWKAKAACRLQEIKTLRVRVRDLQVSRDLWKAKALYLQEQLQQLSAGIPVATPNPQTAARCSTAATPVADTVAEPPPAPPANPDPIVSGHTAADAPKKKRRRAQG